MRTFPATFPLSFIRTPDLLPSVFYTDWTNYDRHVQWMFIAGLSVGFAVDSLIFFSVSFYRLRGTKKVADS
jgi:hypothetical protein